MPIVVVANAQATPPRFEITISTPDGSAITAVSLVRSVGGVKTSTRVQPTTGVASRYIEDPEGDWDTPVTYIATVTYNGGASSSTMTSSPATLVPSPLAFWAIHPTIPSLSMALDVGDFSAVGLAGMGDVVRSAQANQHLPIGADTPLVTKFGRRKAGAGSLDLTTTTLAERDRLLSLVNDETPVLLRCPAAWGWGWKEGFYAFGDVTETRRIQYGPDPTRTMKLPFQRVAAPAGVQQSSWSWGGLAAGYADWNAVANSFADWNTIAGNNPG